MIGGGFAACLQPPHKACLGSRGPGETNEALSLEGGCDRRKETLSWEACSSFCLSLPFFCLPVSSRRKESQLLCCCLQITWASLWAGGAGQGGLQSPHSARHPVGPTRQGQAAGTGGTGQTQPGPVLEGHTGPALRELGEDGGLGPWRHSTHYRPVT